MNDAIARMLNRYECQSVEDHVKALREIMQEIALLGLWRSKFFEKAAFYGGTALRILYGMDRFSEDLDFSLLTPMTDFELSRYCAAVERELRSEKRKKRVLFSQRF
jgi:predicted nucleotidyltransferase component of viral defense system